MELAKDEYEKLLLMMMITRNVLPFLLLQSESFRDFAHVLRDFAPKISRVMMEKRSKDMNEKEFEALKEKLDNNTGKFSNTIDDWRSGNNFDFLVITLHFHNNKFDLKNHTIGFEESSGKISYSSEVFYKFLMIVLRKYGNENRIISITRDNAAPMTDMIDKNRDWSRSQDVEFEGDIPCVGHRMNFLIVALLKNTLFKGKVSNKLDKTMKELLQRHSDFKDFTFRMKHLPQIMRLIIVQINFSHKIKSNFKDLVKEKK